MRKGIVIVIVIVMFLTLAFSAPTTAQDVQKVANQDRFSNRFENPGSGEAVYRFWQGDFFLTRSASADANKGRRRGVQRPEPPSPPYWRAVILTTEEADDIVAALSQVFTWVPYQSMIRTQILAPDGSVFFDDLTPLNIDISQEEWEQNYGVLGGYIWRDKLPLGWETGFVTFRKVLTILGKEYRVSAEWSVDKEAAVQIGPVYRSYMLGGRIVLEGVFTTPPVAGYSYGQLPIFPLEGGGGYYIPADAVLKSGTVPIGVCSGVNGDPYNLYCSTVEVTLP